MTERRRFFTQTIGRAVQEVARLAERRIAPRRFFRPPGAAPEPEFLALCTRCGACIEVCPAHAIVHAAADTGLSAGTPILEPSLRACVVCTDMPCARACPTAALVVPEDGWARIHMGRLELDTERCITFLGSACGVCARACPVGERALSLDAGGRPVIKPEGCVGCGVCVTACVTAPSSLRLSLA
ncbi:MAG TPA: 4Fe-4S dicluster domain-containing protein [Gemmatimonadales bacterium]